MRGYCNQRADWYRGIQLDSVPNTFLDPAVQRQSRERARRQVAAAAGNCLQNRLCGAPWKKDSNQLVFRGPEKIQELRIHARDADTHIAKSVAGGDGLVLVDQARGRSNVKIAVVVQRDAAGRGNRRSQLDPRSLPRRVDVHVWTIQYGQHAVASQDQASRTLQALDRALRDTVPVDPLDAAIATVGDVDQSAPIGSDLAWRAEFSRRVSRPSRTPNREQRIWETGKDLHLMISGVSDNVGAVFQHREAPRPVKVACFFSAATESRKRDELVHHRSQIQHLHPIHPVIEQIQFSIATPCANATG